MPIFNFKCRDENCNKHFERIMKLSELETETIECPECKGDVVRLLSTFGSYSINGNNSASTRPKGVAGRRSNG
jgi:putative FmdB family regulatory protein